MPDRSLAPSVLDCCTAYHRTFAIERGKGARDADAHEEAKMAYRQAMPCLYDQTSIRDFIACVTHGMVLHLISNDDGGKLLYAANVTAGFLRQEQETARKMEKKMARQSSQNAAQTSVVSLPAAAA